MKNWRKFLTILAAIILLIVITIVGVGLPFMRLLEHLS